MSFDRPRTNGNFFIPFMVGLSNHERKAFNQHISSFLMSVLNLYNKDGRM